MDDILEAPIVVWVSRRSKALRCDHAVWQRFLRDWKGHSPHLPKFLLTVEYLKPSVAAHVLTVTSTPVLYPFQFHRWPVRYLPFTCTRKELSHG